ncbi:MAG: hypothetical protein R3E95_21830 [Thiolinea sp.]
MKIKALLAILALSATTTAFAADAPTLKDDVDADTKAAIEAAIAANEAAQGVHFEWIWARPVHDMWSGKLQDNGEILTQAITMANEGKTEEAKKAAAFVEMAAQQGLKQSTLMDKAGPELYGL